MILRFPFLFGALSFNKKYNNAQGGQHRVSGASTGSDSHQNGAHHQQQQALHGMSIDYNFICMCIRVVK